MQRRSFLLGVGAAATAATLAGGALAFELIQDDDDVRRYGNVSMRRRFPAPDAPDVLFISLDDCNDWVGWLRDHPGTITPNLDALAAESVAFTHAYCTAPMCVPARTSVMFGRAPYETGVYDHSDASDARYQSLVTGSSSVVDDFWAAGYDVVSGGKVFGDQQRFRWTQFHRTPTDVTEPYWTSPFDGRPVDASPQKPMDFGPSGLTDGSEPDGETARWVRRQLAAPRSRPLFLGYGAIGTHLAWRVPQKYFDMHPLEDVVVPDYRPADLEDLPPAAAALIRRDPLEALREEGIWAQAVQAYQAAMTFVDAQVGRVLDQLAHSPRADDTIVVLWSDHGFHLGEKLHWHKFTLWEPATRIPMLLRVPGSLDDGRRFDPPVSALDLAPTLADVAGVPLVTPQSGASLVPALADPALADSRPPITTWEPGNHAVRRGPWRFIRYRDGSTELYDHRDDPEELTNLARDASYAAVAAELAAFLPEPTGEVDPDRPPGPPTND